MKFSDAKEYMEECRQDDGTLNEDELENLIIWAYDKGCEETRKDLMKLLEEEFE